MEDAGLNLVRGGDGCGIALTCLVMSFVFVLCLLYFAFVSPKVGMAGLSRREREGEDVWWPPGNLR